MSIYPSLSSLFQLSKYIKDKKKMLSDEEKKIEAENFIEKCKNLLSLTIQTEDEKFMVLSFLSINDNIIEWSISNCSENTANSFKNYKYNFINNKN